jgi:hypothetical protein
MATADSQSPSMQLHHKEGSQAVEQPVEESTQGADGVRAVAVTITAAGESTVKVVMHPVGAEQEIKGAGNASSQEVANKEEGSTCTGEPRMCSGPAFVTPPNTPISPTKGPVAKSIVSHPADLSSAGSDKAGACGSSLATAAPEVDGPAGPVAESGPVGPETPASQQGRELSAGKESVVGCFTKLREAWSRGLHGCYTLQG